MPNQGPPTLPAYERLLWIDRVLAGGRPLTVGRIQERLEVSARTVFRDLAFLRERLGAPLEFDRQRHSFCYSNPSYRLPACFLTEGELVSVCVAAKVLEQYAGTPFEADLRRAFAKIRQALPETVSVDAAAVQDALSFDLGPARWSSRPSAGWSPPCAPAAA